MKRMAAFLLVWALLVVPFVMGATPVTSATQESNTTYTPTTDNNLGTIKGGYIYNYTLNVEEQTKYWAGIYGTINQTVVLKDAAGNAFYTWTPSSISYQAVILSEESGVDFAGTFEGNIVDQNVVNAGVWSAAPSVEGVDNTFTVATGTECDFAGISLASGSWKYVDTSDGTTAYWRTCIAGWDGDGTNAIDNAADGIIIAGQVDPAGHTAYDGTTTANYQVLVPAPDTGIAYYVWVA